jgi:hypothetical protein
MDAGGSEITVCVSHDFRDAANFLGEGEIGGSVRLNMDSMSGQPLHRVAKGEYLTLQGHRYTSFDPRAV